MKKITLLDTTLRDGAQGESISFSAEDKIKIALWLDELGIDYIEGGNPFSSETDREFFRRMKEIPLNSKLVAFGSTRRKNSSCEEDENISALISSGVKTVAVFGKSWDLQVKKILNTALAENLRMIYDSVLYLKNAGLEVIFDAEHFFDGLKSNPQYALKAIKTASMAGADLIVLCDTNGGNLEESVVNGVKRAIKAVGNKVGVHVHNDMALAVSNSMQAVFAGAVHLQGTLLGFGERCGNADLSSIIPNLEFKTEYQTIGKERLKLLYSISRRIAQTANLTVWKGKPYVGSAAFAHKGGMHIDAVLKHKESFEHIDPEAVGNERRYLFSEVSGKAAALFAINKVLPEYSKENEAVSLVSEKIKDLENKGYRFEAAEESLELLVRRTVGEYKNCFELKNFSVSEKYPASDYSATASVTVKIDGEEISSSKEGYGPVHALDNAIKAAAAQKYPALATVRLVDYKVRVMNPEWSTAASVAVLIESTNGEKRWSTVGASSDVIAASALALYDSYDYCLQHSLKEEK